nr:PREDICTED: serine-rich adhesin for platelets-like [Nicotiana tabacum]
MGVELLEIGVQMRRVVMFSIKGCYKTVLNHPFLVSMLCFIAFLYRSFPFLFSILVATSPVLVCTAVLLGTLLSFGQPNIPEIERKEKTTHDIVEPLKTGLLCDTTHIESEDSYYVERYTDNERDAVEQSIDKVSDLSPLLEERSREFQFGNGVFNEAAREFYEQNSEKKEEKHNDGEDLYSPIPMADGGFEEAEREFYEQNDEKNEEKHDDEELMESQYSPIPTVDEGFEESEREFYEQNDEEKHDDGELMESQYSPIPTVDEGFEESEREFYEQNDEEKHDDGELIESQYSPIPTVDNESIEFDFDRSDSFDSKRVNLNSLPGSPWKKEESDKEEEQEEEDDEDDESFDSESDRAESSSPDASMADIIPMFDELHPLLDEDTPQHVSLSHDDGFDAASDSSGKFSASDNESDDGCENQEEVEVAHDENEEGTRDKEDKSKSAITWTEEDQKNLIDLGSSEVERNQRLESLMARRRALKKMRLMMTEKNLIDLDTADLPFNIPPISTARNNPFDVPKDNYELGLPPIPGSAPSILVPRRNPFDLPYDSSEEKPDLMEDSFEEEFMAFRPKEPVLRRNETFSARPSLFGVNRQDSHFRPYFVPERMASEGTSYSPFQRQSSELSDSKVSSVPETDSLGSVEDLIEEVDVRHKSLDEEELEHKDLIDEHISEEPELISKMEHTSEHVRNGSESSEEVESLEQLGAVEIHHEVEETLLQEGRVSNALELNPTEIQSKSETSDQIYSNQSSSSSLEVSERVIAYKEEEEEEEEEETVSSLEETMGDVEQNGISRQASFNGSDFHITSTSAEQTSHREPIYDTSPSASMENIFSASLSSDQLEESETGFSAILVKRSVSFLERESEESSQDIQRSISTNEEISAPVADQEFLSRDEVCKRELDVAKVEISQHEFFGSASAPPVTEFVVGQASTDSKLSANEDIGNEEGTIEHAQHQISSSGFNADTHIVSQFAVDQTVEFLSKSSEHENIHQLDDEQHSLIAEEVPLVQPDMPSLERDSVDDAAQKEEAIISELHDLPSSNFVVNLVTDAHSEFDEKLISSEHQFASVEKAFSLCEEDVACSDKSMDEQSSEDHNVMEPPVILVESIEEASTTENLNMPEIHDLDDGIPIINSPRTPDSFSNLHVVDEAPGGAGLSGLRNNILDEVENDNQIKVLENYVLPLEAADFHHDEQYIVEETDGISDIDEVFLSELDTVGDFSIKGSSQNEFERQINSSAEDLSSFHAVDSGTTEVSEEACAEVHERKVPLHPENFNASTFEEIDEREEKECASDIQNYGLRSIDHIDVVDPRSIEGGFSEDSDTGPSYPSVKHNLDAHEIVPEMPIVEAHNSVFEVENLQSTQTGVTEEETDSGMPVLEAQTIQDIESAFWQVYEKEIEKSNILEQSNAEDSGMPVLEAQTIEDIELAFRSTSEKEIEHSDVLELPNSELVTEQSGSSNNDAVVEMSSSVQEDSGMPVLEAQTVENIELAFGSTSEKEIEHPNVLELPNAELVTEQSGSLNNVTAVEVSSSVQEDSGMPVLEAQTVEDIELAFRNIWEKKIEHSDVLELPNAELVTELFGSSNNAAAVEVSSSVQEDSGMPVLEAQTVEDIEFAFRNIWEKEIEHSDALELPKAKLVTEESGSSDNAAVFKVSSSVQKDFGMPVVEAQTIEDIESAFRSTSERETENSNVLELANAELVTEESGNNAAVVEMSSSVQEDSGMPVLEAQTVEDIELAFRNIWEKEIEKSNVFELPNAKLVTEESGSSDSAAAVEAGMQVLEAQTIKDIELAFRSTCEKEIDHSDVLELPNAELATEESGNNLAAVEVSSSVPKDTGMPVLEAQTIEDIELAFRQISENETETENSNVLELPNAELLTEESGNNAAAVEVSSSALEDSGMPVLEAETVEDIDTVFRRISEKEIEKSNVLEQPNAELATDISGNSDNAAVLEVSSVTRAMQLPILETRQTEYFDLDHENLSESDSDEHTEKSRDIGAPSDSQNIDTDLALKQVLEGNLEKPLNSTSEGELVEAKPSEAGLSNDTESSARGSDVSEFGEGETGKGDHEVVVKEAKELTAEKPGHVVDMPTTADVKGKKDKHQKSGSSSSSSSSSSSDSSSSDSERE